MKNLWDCLVVAFSTYSAIPMPQVQWSQRNMRYAMCFFPLIGLIIGALLLGWAQLRNLVGIGPLLFGAVATVLPLLVTGGIHLDGFCDTCDALGSHQPREKKLEILKDSHAGAFALMGCGAYLLLSLGLWSEMEMCFPQLGVVALGFVLSRCLSGLSVVTFPCASRGLLAAFSQSAQKKRVAAVMLCLIVLCAAGMFLLDPLAGALALLGSSGCFLYYFVMSRRQFGGITGDLAGYFLQLCEIVILAAVVIAQKL